LEFLGRRDHQIKLRGFRIELGEIEHALEQHPDIASAVVQVRPLRDDQALVAYLVLAAPADQAADPDHTAQAAPASVELVSALRSFLETRLPAYMVPTHVVVLPAMPLTPNGKIDRKVLPAPQHDAPLSAGTTIAPRDSLEVQLAAIWEDVLGRYPVGVTDDFFLLGGHSLAAVRVMARIEQQFGVKLPLNAFFQEPTISYLAGLLRQHSDQLPQSPLVAIQPHGTRPPLFFVHPLGGQVFHYRDLAHALGTDQPFYAFQDLAYDQDTEPYRSIEQLAATYIEALRLIQPAGPYSLGGHSFGGPVAFEMAQQLARQGEEIALLAIFDTTAPQVSMLNSVADDAVLLAELLDIDLSAALEQLRLLAPEEQVAYVLGHINQTDWGRDLSAEWITRRLAVFKARSQALALYEARSYNGRIALFRAEESAAALAATLATMRQALAERQPETGTTIDAERAERFMRTVTDDPTWGWGGIATESTLVHVVPGDHGSMLLPPNVSCLAGVLSDYLGE
ncbi:MAG TPA: thioesterase domain-containing protein, partial [Roseiflexaceae bacterium]|nr:thioesterase domain-containing protein [Roseiflexaceae bacterium]